jgi:hypothetical protein
MSFGAYQPEDQVISSDAVVSPMWSDSATTLSTFYTWSSQEQNTSAGKFYLDVYKGNISTDSTQTVQFSIAYGHINGSGSAYFNSLVPDKTPTRDVYGQFRSLIYGDENSSFQFGGTAYTSSNIIVLSVARARFKESFNPGSFYLTIKSGSSQISLVDDSTTTTTSTYIGTTRVYQLLSGSYDSNTQLTSVSSSNYTVSGSYGVMLPSEGLIILNPEALALPAGALGGIGAIFNEFSSSQAADYFTGLSYTYNINNRMVFEMISGATNPKFNLQSYETISSRYFFTRVKNADFNYTTNPTVIDSNGNLLFTQLVYNPQTYITTVGLYNNSGDLLAVAKLNKPLVKDFTKELLLRVKLDF